MLVSILKKNKSKNQVVHQRKLGKIKREKKKCEAV